MSNSTHKTVTGNNANKTPLDKLRSFLNELFQFESQDLDFGVYRILHYKRREIKQFIDKLLVDKVHEELDTLAHAQSEELKQELEDLKSSSTITGWMKAKKENNAEKLKFYEEEFPEELREYRKLDKQVQSLKISEGTENQIYNHLTLFFSRYYDNGDFISKRRFGRKEKYIVPYNGEETHFFWANHDQYYVKSSEHFQQYSFKVPHQNGTLDVAFKLRKAETEQGNVKSEEEKYFILSDQDPAWDGDHLTIYFEYRPLTREEIESLKKNGKQEGLDERSSELLKKKLQKDFRTHKLWEVDDQERTFMFRKLRHFTRKNSYDFFIHKDLKGFLQRELDFYIKSELVEVDDLYVSESDFHFERVRQSFKKIKVFKNIADTIIEFLAQIENFQKKLWEKKKFVIDTQYVITIDRLVEYVGEESARPLLEEVIKNEGLVAEWRDLLGKDNIPNNLDEVDQLRYELNTWRKYPIDTTFFSEEFKERLLGILSNSIELDQCIDGILFQSDNFHGQDLLMNKYWARIDLVHIDPPYNTNSTSFLYKNSYQHSSWLTMMNDRISKSIKLLSNKGAFATHIDENEYENIHQLLDELGLKDMGTMIWDKGSPVTGTHGIATQHEYVLWRSKENIVIKSIKRNIQEMRNKVNELINNQKKSLKVAIREYRSWLKSNQKLSRAEKIYDTIDDNGRIFRSADMTATDYRTDKKFHIPLIHPKTKKKCPVPSNGWRYKPETIQKLIEDDLIIFGDDEKKIPRRKVLLSETTTSQLPSILSSGYRGKQELDNLGIKFPFAHSSKFYSVLTSAIITEKNKIVMDFFAGSGTSYHSTAILNKDFDFNTKCILIEQGDYVRTIIKPRIKKIAYTFDWKDGQPQNGSMNGLGVFFKYQRLEQYEETLENIEFTIPEEAQQQALELDDYIPKYVLEFETRDSQTLVNTENMKNPWEYELRVWDGYSYDSRNTVDLVETFNYLIGLHVEKLITREFNGIKYQFVQGVNNDSRRILVVWRNVKGWKEDDFTKDREILQRELKNFSYDQLYLNGQAHLENYMLIEEVFKNKMVP